MQTKHFSNRLKGGGKTIGQDDSDIYETKPTVQMFFAKVIESGHFQRLDYMASQEFLLE